MSFNVVIQFMCLTIFHVADVIEVYEWSKVNCCLTTLHVQLLVNLICFKFSVAVSRDVR